MGCATWDERAATSALTRAYGVMLASESANSHGNAESLLIDEFPRDVHIIRSWPRHGGMMAGLQN